MVHTLFSIVAPLSHGKPTVREHALAFGGLRMLHFASVVLFDEPAGAAKGTYPGHVVLESCIDGTLDDYLDALVFEFDRRVALADLFQNCAGFALARNAQRDVDPQQLREYLAAHVVRPHLFHIGTPGLRVDHITSGHLLHRALDHEIKKLAPTGISHEKPLDIARQLRRLLRVPDSAKTHWHLDPASVESRKYAWFSDPVSLWPSRIVEWGKLLLAGVVLLLLPFVALVRLGKMFGWHVPAIIVAAAVIAAAWWWKWLQGKHAPSGPDEDALHALTEQEDEGVHNHMASLALLKPGLLRRLTIRAVLGTLNLFYRTLFTDVTPGKILGLPTIHFAQWSIVKLPPGPAGRRREAVMFLSNYDGSWETYLDDFLTFLLRGVIAIWGNAEAFPSPLDGRIFKQWARGEMHPYAVWHDKVYPDLSVPNIQNNDRLRLGLLDPPQTDYEARLWLARLGAVKRGDEQFDEVTGPLPTDDMQGLMLRGYGALPHAAYVLLRLDEGEGARRWLGDVIPSVTDGRELDKKDLAREAEAVNIAFTHRGLEVLGLPAPVLNRFPLPFREGIAPVRDGKRLDHRSRILGDVGDSAPDHWVWGGRRGRDRDVDVLLMLYANTPARLTTVRRRMLDAFARTRAGEVIDVIHSDRIVDPVHRQSIEHFGFADGLSQPSIEGTWQVDGRNGRALPADLLKPGEFMLGYESGDGSITPGVPVEAAFDPDNVLPWSPPPERHRDFGRNGTFLVARQLEQDVAEFRAFTARAAGVSMAQHATRAAETVAARLVGRWKSGTPLVEPERPGDSNAFSFASDPHGFKCPIGAHIRRSNPRDSLGTDAAAARATANRHRLLRRGRAYGPPLSSDAPRHDGADRGLMFIGLNADLERQFEFVQQNWINSPVFGGLNAELDPLVGATRPPAHVTFQGNAVCTQLEGLSRFVTVVGGGYFFMPGMRALRYLARLQPAALPRGGTLPEAAQIAPPRYSRLRKVFDAVAALLPMVRLLWASRFPVLLAIVIAVLPIAAARRPEIALPFFLTSASGVALVAFLASAAAWTVMVTLRLVLLYGTRVGLPRAIWTRDAKWFHLFAFQMLALPAVIASIVYTVQDAAGAEAPTRAIATRLSVAAAGGLALGIVALGIATAIQSLRAGSRPNLFAPPLPVVTRSVERLARIRLIDRASRVLSAVSSWIINSVPEEIGAGYIDYRNRRLLPGHPFAAALAFLVCIVYVAGFFVFNPSRRPAQLEMPPAAYMLFILMALGWILSAAAFFLDRYRIPTALTVAAWLIVVASVAKTDHVFELGGPIEPAATPAEMAAAAQVKRPGKVIVVASEGYALASSAWTAEVLTRLAAEETGARFVNAVRLISASSGATVAAAQFVDAYTSGGFAGLDARSLQALRVRSRAPAASDGWWGLVYPDLIRAFAPMLVPRREDRGWALEQAWRRQLPDDHQATLSAWRRGVKDGWRPATVFGVTSVETGEQGLLATYRARTHNPDGPDFVTLRRDVSILTAARLAASFPYVSPAPRPDTDAPSAYHFTDGGFWDNSGLAAALQWIDDAGPGLGTIMLIEVRSSPRSERKPPTAAPWTLEAFGPLRTLVQVRYDGDAVRTEEALQAFLRTHAVQRVVFELNDTRIPFTWNLGLTPVRYIEDAWKRGDNQEQRAKVRTFLSTQ